MTHTALLEELDLPTRRTQEPELGAGDLGIVKHQRVELMQGQPLPRGLYDDEAAMIAQAAAAALSVEKLDQLQPLPMISISLMGARCIRVLGALSGRVTLAARGRELLWSTHPMDDGGWRILIQTEYGDRDDTTARCDSGAHCCP